MVLLLPPSSITVELWKNPHFQAANSSSKSIGRTFQVAALKRSPPPRKLPKNLRYPRREKVPADPKIRKSFPLNKEKTETLKLNHEEESDAPAPNCESGAKTTDVTDDDVLGDSVWTEDEISVISALFERGPPKQENKLQKERPLPLPSPYKSRTPGFPTPKHHIRSVSRDVVTSRSSISTRISKNPDFLVGLAKEIGALPSDMDASQVLDKWGRFLRKGSLSMTIRELGHMGLPDRALQTLCWVQNHSPALFPDDRVLASTVEVLARNGQLKMECRIDKYLFSASRSVVEAIARGFIGAGNLSMARKVLLFAKDNNRTLDVSIHVKLMLEAVKNPDMYKLVEALLDELGDRADLDLQPQDCTAIMKVCIKLGRFEAVESLFNWFKESGRSPTVVMYTTVIHSRYSSGKYREGLAVVWEMEDSNILIDLPAYRVVIRLCVALDDLARAARYFSRLKEAGFTPTYDIYRDMIKAYAASGRRAKCRQICRELETAGLRVDNGIASLLIQIEEGAKQGP